MISVFDLFKIGIGPSSSHTVGPMKAAAAFMSGLDEQQRAGLKRLKVSLLGSLAWTGRGHRTDKAVMLGLCGFSPDTIDPDGADRRVDVITATKQLVLQDGTTIGFDPAQNIDFNLEEPASVHPNTMRFSAFDQDGRELKTETWYSLGGGFIRREGEASCAPESTSAVPFDYRDAAELIEMCDRSGLSIAELVRANETVFADEASVHDRLDRLTAVMFDCIDRGIRTDGELPGGLKVKRRARIARPAASVGEPQSAEFDPGDGLCEPVRDRSERGKRGGRAGRDRADQWCGRRDSRRPAILRRSLPGCVKGWHQNFSPDQFRDRRALQDECIDLRRRSRMPGRGRCGMLHGCRRPHRGTGRQQQAD